MIKSETPLRWGHGQVTRSDLVLVRKALREGWGPTHEVQRAIAADIMEIIRDDAAPDRLKIAGARTAIAMIAEDHRLVREQAEYDACRHLCVNWLKQHSPADADSLLGK